MSNKVFNESDGAALVAALDTLKAEVQNATLVTPQEALDPLAPTPFAPTTQALDDAIANFVPLPYSESEVLAVITKVKKAAETESRMQKFGERASVVLNA